MEKAKIEEHLNKARLFTQTLRPVLAENELRKLTFLEEDGCCDIGYRIAYLDLRHRLAIFNGENDAGMSFMEKAITIAPDDNSRGAMCASLAHDYYYRQADRVKTVVYADKALSLVDEPVLKISPLSLKGFCLLDESKYEEALQCFGDAEYIAEQAHAPGERATTIMGIAKVYRAMGKLEIALSEMTRAERYAKETRNLELGLKFYIKKIDLLFEMGKDAEARQLITLLAKQEN